MESLETGSNSAGQPKPLGEVDWRGNGGGTWARAKTPLRLKYEAETRVLRARLGSLEDIRNQLGLSRRQMCQLLMVDPSAWTRWTRDESKVPPHIYRALQWYLALIEKSPSWHPANSFRGSLLESDRPTKYGTIPPPSEPPKASIKPGKMSHFLLFTVAIQSFLLLMLILKLFT